jgi:leader peptidase (prepilin peptidase) / N-methyltransferase
LIAVRVGPATAAERALLVAWLIFALAGIILSAVDIAAHRLPTRVVAGTAGLMTAAISAAALLERNSEILVHAGLGALTAGGIYLLLFVLVPNGIGAGDVRLAAVTGLTLGSSGWRTVILGLALPYLLCLPYAAATVIRHRGRHSARIPFGPFLITGSLIAGIAAR